MQVFLYILGNNVVPIFTVIFLGFALEGIKIDIFTLTKLNFYIYVPLFMFVNLYTTTIDLTLLKALILAFCTCL